MGELNSLLKEFEKKLSDFDDKLLESLAPGLPQTEVFSLLEKVNVRDEKLVNLYVWKNGCNYDEYAIGERDICSFGQMLSLKSAIEIYNISVIENNSWEKRFFPIIGEGGGIYVLINVDREHENYGMLYLFAPSFILKENPQTIFDSLECFFETQILCFGNNVFKKKEGGYWDINYDLEKEISVRINSKSEYWKYD